MAESSNSLGNSPGNFAGSYRIEVSGWGLDSNFFVEKTDLYWSQNGEKRVQLRRSLPEGVIVFVRLLAPESPNRAVPIAYSVHEVEPIDCDGRCGMKLTQFYPRSRRSSSDSGESHGQKSASNEQEDGPRACDVLEKTEELEREEALL